MKNERRNDTTAPAPTRPSTCKLKQDTQAGCAPVSDEAQTIRVECYAGHRGEETPRRFRLGEHQIEVVEVVDRWLAPDHRYFKVRGESGSLYVLRHDVESGEWELVVFDGTDGKL